MKKKITRTIKATKRSDYSRADIDLMGWVAQSQAELRNDGCFTEVFQLPRATRKRLDHLIGVFHGCHEVAGELGPVAKIECAASIHRLLADAGCEPYVADSFLLKEREYCDRYVVGGWAACERAQRAA